MLQLMSLCNPFAEILFFLEISFSYLCFRFYSDLIKGGILCPIITLIITNIHSFVKQCTINRMDSPFYFINVFI